jgi:hypothetical protein
MSVNQAKDDAQKQQEEIQARVKAAAENPGSKSGNIIRQAVLIIVMAGLVAVIVFGVINSR